MMNKLAIPILSLFVFMLTGCNNNGVSKHDQQFINDSYSKCLETVNYKGHSYIIYKGYKQGGILHDPDCQCKDGENN